jgi:hypothetical protein
MHGAGEYLDRWLGADGFTLSITLTHVIRYIPVNGSKRHMHCTSPTHALVSHTLMPHLVCNASSRKEGRMVELQ